MVMALVPLFLRAPWRARLSWAAAVFVPAVLVVQTWHAYAQWRWGSAVILKVSTGLLAAAIVLTPLLVPSRWRRYEVAAVALIVVSGVAIMSWSEESTSQFLSSDKRRRMDFELCTYYA